MFREVLEVTEDSPMKMDVFRDSLDLEDAKCRHHWYRNKSKQPEKGNGVPAPLLRS